MCHLSPLKGIGFAWCACMDSIPITMTISHRGIAQSSPLCHLCSNGLDETDHVLARYPFSKEALEWVLKWCDIPFIHFSSVVDFVKFAVNREHCPQKRKFLLATFYASLWCIWKAGNNKIFNKVQVLTVKTVDNVIILVHSWVKNKGNFGICNYVDRCCLPFNIL